MAGPDRTTDQQAPASGTASELLLRLAAGTPARPAALGRYDVVGRLGQGGMGTVYEAVDRERGTPVALKTLSMDDAAAGVRLKREFRVVADIAHPNLATVYELACAEGLWFFAMERIEGQSFARWARGPSSAERPTARLPLTQLPSMAGASTQQPTTELVGARKWLDNSVAGPPLVSMEALRGALTELVRGLSALHDAGLWHGDIKPENVLVRPDGRVVIVDFGLAQPVGDSPLRRGPTAGTPIYMSSEQLSGTDVGPASDWYAVGTMLYEALTGRLPFEADSLLDLYFKKTHQTPPAPRDLLPELPADLNDVCMSLLQPMPDRRPSGHELLRIFAGDEEARLRVAERAVRSAFVGRQRELRRLEQAYGVARSGKTMVVHAHGPSGIGKSAMVRSFVRGVEDVDGAQVLRGRCYERESVPYKAFDGIVDELAERLQRLSARVVDKLLPDWIGELTQMFPALAAVPAISARAKAPAQLDAVELRRRAWSALQELVGTLAGERPVVLSIDDLQWADADSARLLETLLSGEAGQLPLLVVASYRPAEAAANPALTGYFERCAALRSAGQLMELPVGPLPAAEAELLARSTLRGLGGASESRLRFLAEEAAGVPFFIEELARFAATQGAAALTADVSLEDAIRARVRALPAEQRALIELVAVAETPVPQSLVFEVAGLEAGALPALLALRSASMLTWSGAGKDDLVSTYHDRIRECVVRGLDEPGRASRHLALGRALVARHAGQPMGPWVFEAVRHLGAAGPALNAAQERLATARLALEAGRLARQAAAFPLAFACFERGIALLGGDAWQAEYALALALHSGAAEAAYLSAEWTAMDTRVADVKAHGRTVMDQLVAWEVQIDALIGRHEYLAAIEAAKHALALLGIELPTDPSQAEIGAAFQRTLDELTRIGPDALAAMPDVDDPMMAAAMRIQVRLSPAAYFGKPSLLPILASNLVQTSIARGLSYATPYALAVFGIVLNTVGLYPVSHTWGQLAVKLIDRWPDRSQEAATRHVVYNLVCPWMVPLHTTLAPLREVFDIGRRTGDLEYASYAAHGWVHNCMYAGKPLAPLLTEALELGAQMRAFGQINAVHVHAPFEQLLRCLTGASPDPSRLDDAGYDEQAQLAAAAEEGSRSGLFVLRLVMGLARYSFGKPAEASEHLELARSYLDAAPSVWHVPIFHQFAALAACARWDAAGPDQRTTLRAHADRSLAELRTLAGHAPVNFAHRVSLVEGELRRIDGDPAGALATFDAAIEQAREASWIPDIALAHELAARCPGGDPSRRRIAREIYAAWGATAKAATLA